MGGSHLEYSDSIQTVLYRGFMPLQQQSLFSTNLNWLLKIWVGTLFATGALSEFSYLPVVPCMWSKEATGTLVQQYQQETHGMQSDITSSH